MTYVYFNALIVILFQLPIPWKSLLLSKALLINLVTQTGGIWGLFTLSAQAPSYFNFVLGLNIKQVYCANYIYRIIIVKKNKTFLRQVYGLECLTLFDGPFLLDLVRCAIV